MLFNPKRTWIGLSHYAAVLTDPEFLEIVLPNTFLFMVASVTISLVIGLALAIALNRPFRGQKLVQTVLLLPLMVAPVIAAIMVRWIFNDQFGAVNALIEVLGLERASRGWCSAGPPSRIIVLTDCWLWTPWFTLLLLAGLQSLPKEPFEAAAIDGTTRLARVLPPDAADAAPGDRRLRGDPRDRRLSHLRHRLGAHRRRAGPARRSCSASMPTCRRS